jgi:SAM-dependent methyltransferase
MSAAAPDIETASEGYARRFAGPTGAFLLEAQEEGVRRLLAAAGLLGPDGRAARPLRVLEVGGGHAQLTPFLLATGCTVVVQGSAPACAARLAPLLARHGDRLAFVVAPLDALPFAPCSFDLVVALRLLAHSPRDDLLLVEMARVGRGRILVDFAPLWSLNLLEPLLFRLKHRLEGDTRPFLVHRTGRLCARLAALGLGRLRLHRQLALPLVLHRALGRPGLSARLERAAAALRLTRLLGAPALLLAEGAPGGPAGDEPAGGGATGSGP